MKRKQILYEEVLDYLIISQIFSGKDLKLSLDDPRVIALYDYLGRWLPKDKIYNRIEYYDKLRRESAGDKLPFLRDSNYPIGALRELTLTIERNSFLFQEEEFIEVDGEVLVEVNNLCNCGKRKKCSNF